MYLWEETTAVESFLQEMFNAGDTMQVTQQVHFKRFERDGIILVASPVQGRFHAGTAHPITIQVRVFTMIWIVITTVVAR